MIYGYCRISTKKQNIERQIRNIKDRFPEAVIVEEVYTGTKFQGRQELDKVLKKIKSGDMIVFDSVSRMSRNATEGWLLYENLFKSDIELVFLKEPHCSTSKYREALQKQLDITISTGDKATDKFMSSIIDALNELQMSLAKKDIELAFEQSQKEVDDLRQRTKEGIETARLNGKQIGQRSGKKIETKKAIHSKKLIQKYNYSFDGHNSNEETIKLIGIARATFYKYKRELLSAAEVEN